MNDVEKKGENMDFEDGEINSRSSSSIDVDRYIHAVDESDIGLDIFKQSKGKAAQNNQAAVTSRTSASNIPESVKKKALSKNRKAKNQKLRGIIVSVIVFVLITAIGIGTVLFISGRKNNILSVNFRYSTETKEVGTVKSIIKRDVKYAYGVYYPHFNKENIDLFIEQQNEKIIDTFLEKYKHFKPSAKGTGVIMFSDYESTDFVDYYQIVRKTEYRLPDGETTQHILTAFYDIKNDKVIVASDFFDSNFKQIISVKVANYFEENTSMSSDDISALTDYRKIDISNFSLDGSNFYLYINDINGNTVTIRFPLDSSIAGHFKINYKTLQENYNLSHKSAEETTALEVEETTEESFDT